MSVGIYARVSTQDQQTLPMQFEKMREYMEHHKRRLPNLSATLSASAFKPESPMREKKTNRIADHRPHGKKDAIIKH